MMGFLSNLFGKKKEEHSITDYQGFWQWFKQEAPAFHKVIKDRPRAEYVEEHFLDKVLDKLHQLNEQFFCVAGLEDGQVSLTITAEGDIKTFVFVEELIAAAPAIPGWTFTALQQPTDEPIEGIKLELQGYVFNNETLSFFSNDQPDYPDEIDLVFVYKNYKKEDHNIIANGTLLYLDNVLGELKFATLIDNVTIRGAEPDDKELIPLEKLEPFLAWREKEFVEKYHAAQCNTEDNDYSVLEALDENELPLLAVVNSSLMDWEAKPSHPWMLCLEIVYKPGHAGMPGDDDHEHMQKLDEWLEAHFTDAAGTYSIVRETYNGTRTIYYACREFRQSSKLADALLKEYKNKLKVNVSIFKDKYWQSLNRFRQSPDLSGDLDME